MFARILSYFYSNPCHQCDRTDIYSNRFGICKSCIRLNFHLQKKAMESARLCPICSQNQDSEGDCEFCSSRFVFFDRVLSLRFRLGRERKLLQACKFQNERILSSYFALDFLRILRAFKRPPDGIILLPSKDLDHDRTYHPAKPLANRLSKRWKIPIINAVHKLSKEKQSGKNYHDRFLHAKKAFVLTKKDRSMRGLHILIIDDVFTTGASINEVARMILAAGAERVSCMVLLSNEGD